MKFLPTFERDMKSTFERDLKALGLTRPHWARVVAGKMSLSGKCMSSKGTAEGGRCWCCEPYGHDGPHANPHCEETWTGDTPEEQFDEEVARIEKL